MERDNNAVVWPPVLVPPHTTEKLGVPRDEERWGKWEISLKKREKQQTGVVSFPGLAPDTALMTPKPPRCPTGADPAPEKAWPGLKR